MSKALTHSLALLQEIKSQLASDTHEKQITTRTKPELDKLTNRHFHEIRDTEQYSSKRSARQIVKNSNFDSIRVIIQQIKTQQQAKRRSLIKQIDKEFEKLANKMFKGDDSEEIFDITIEDD